MIRFNEFIFIEFQNSDSMSLRIVPLRRWWEWICTDARMSDAHKQWSKVKLVRKVLEKPTKSQSKSHRSKSEAKQVSIYCSSEDSNDIYFYTCIRKWYWRTEKKLYDIIASLHKSFLCEIIFHKRYLKDPPYDLSYIDVREGGGLLSGTFEQVNA